MCHCNTENRWDKISYPQNEFTSLGETPSGGSWPLYYFKRSPNGGFTDLNGNDIAFNIKIPDISMDFSHSELSKVIDISYNLTDAEKTIASYWGAGVPQNQLIPILQTLINAYGVPAVSASRLYSIVSNATNDAMVICWYYKYAFQIPRPVQYDPCFTPYLKTPEHPSYPAGHAVSAGCFAGILSHFFPAEKERLIELAKECSISRLYAGVHYPLDLSEGYNLGLDVANRVLDAIKNDKDSYGTIIDKVYSAPKDVSLMPPPYTQTFKFK
ncbi:vanadium-dependent haloperoxidase [Clostridium sp. MSJ-11]|uniref:Vanadium-dependent haloperoxidase n=1 Tax=Clostridium mobile TaxID=2841512 RepID=A0ABS6EIV0_9CLOT|nr:vanadium-dependent haloperoxidase [Clostridium mobile]MBU5484616.1 vanadium-dependent haloperoxidase [Clostridium mobile]